MGEDKPRLPATIDIRKDPLALVLIIAIFATTFYLFAPRVFRFFCIGAGLSWWQSAPVASIKATVDACTSVYHGESHGEYNCRGNVGFLACQTVVYTIVVMCVLMEIEYIVVRIEGKRTSV